MEGNTVVPQRTVQVGGLGAEQDDVPDARKRGEMRGPAVVGDERP